jgi:hypothetical protein
MTELPSRDLTGLKKTDQALHTTGPIIGATMKIIL